MVKTIAFIVGIVFITAASYDQEAREMNWFMLAGMLLIFALMLQSGGYHPGDVPEDPRR